MKVDRVEFPEGEVKKAVEAKLQELGKELGVNVTPKVDFEKKRVYVTYTTTTGERGTATLRFYTHPTIDCNKMELVPSIQLVLESTQAIEKAQHNIQDTATRIAVETPEAETTGIGQDIPLKTKGGIMHLIMSKFSEIIQPDPEESIVTFPEISSSNTSFMPTWVIYPWKTPLDKEGIVMYKINPKLIVDDDRILNKSELLREGIVEKLSDLGTLDKEAWRAFVWFYYQQDEWSSGMEDPYNWILEVADKTAQSEKSIYDFYSYDAVGREYYYHLLQRKSWKIQGKGYGPIVIVPYFDVGEWWYGSIAPWATAIKLPIKVKTPDELDNVLEETFNVSKIPCKFFACTEEDKNNLSRRRTVVTTSKPVSDVFDELQDKGKSEFWVFNQYGDRQYHPVAFKILLRGKGLDKGVQIDDVEVRLKYIPPLHLDRIVEEGLCDDEVKEIIHHFIDELESFDGDAHALDSEGYFWEVLPNWIPAEEIDKEFDLKEVIKKCRENARNCKITTVKSKSGKYELTIKLYPSPASDDVIEVVTDLDVKRL
jgi:hypothetical protein